MMIVDRVAAVDLVAVEVDSVVVEVNQRVVMQKMVFLFVMQMQTHEIAVDALKMTALPSIVTLFTISVIVKRLKVRFFS